HHAGAPLRLPVLAARAVRTPPSDRARPLHVGTPARLSRFQLPAGRDTIPVRHAGEGFSPTGFIRHARRTADKSLNVRQHHSAEELGQGPCTTEASLRNGNACGPGGFESIQATTLRNRFAAPLALWMAVW